VRKFADEPEGDTEKSLRGLLRAIKVWVKYTVSYDRYSEIC